MGIPPPLAGYAEAIFRRFPEAFLALGAPDLDDNFDLWEGARRQVFENHTQKVVQIVLQRRVHPYWGQHGYQQRYQHAQQYYAPSVSHPAAPVPDGLPYGYPGTAPQANGWPSASPPPAAASQMSGQQQLLEHLTKVVGELSSIAHNSQASQRGQLQQRAGRTEADVLEGLGSLVEDFHSIAAQAQRSTGSQPQIPEARPVSHEQALLLQQAQARVQQAQAYAVPHVPQAEVFHAPVAAYHQPASSAAPRQAQAQEPAEAPQPKALKVSKIKALDEEPQSPKGARGKASAWGGGGRPAKAASQAQDLKPSSSQQSEANMVKVLGKRNDGGPSIPASKSAPDLSAANSTAARPGKVEVSKVKSLGEEPQSPKGHRGSHSSWGGNTAKAKPARPASPVRSPSPAPADTQARKIQVSKVSALDKEPQSPKGLKGKTSAWGSASSKQPSQGSSSSSFQPAPRSPPRNTRQPDDETQRAASQEEARPRGAQQAAQQKKIQVSKCAFLDEEPQSPKGARGKASAWDSVPVRSTRSVERSARSVERSASCEDVKVAAQDVPKARPDNVEAKGTKVQSLEQEPQSPKGKRGKHSGWGGSSKPAEPVVKAVAQPRSHSAEPAARRVVQVSKVKALDQEPQSPKGHRGKKSTWGENAAPARQAPASSEPEVPAKAAAPSQSSAADAGKRAIEVSKLKNLDQEPQSPKGTKKKHSAW